MFENHAKDRLRDGKLVLCMGLRQARTADVAMIARAAGFDAVYVDMEHSPISFDATAAICTGALGLGITPMVRIPGHRGEDASRALDGGAQGIIVPQLADRAQAEAIVDACRFPPLGQRSVMGPGPATGYRPLPLGEVNASLNARTLVIPMIETPDAVARADEIAAVDGVDVLLIGSNDLCTAMGIPGQLRHPSLLEAYEQVARACRAHGKTLGVGGIRGDAELQARLLALGARFVIAGSDVSYLAAAARNDAEQLRALGGDGSGA